MRIRWRSQSCQSQLSSEANRTMELAGATVVPSSKAPLESSEKPQWQVCYTVNRSFGKRIDAHV